MEKFNPIGVKAYIVKGIELEQNKGEISCKLNDVLKIYLVPLDVETHQGIKALLDKKLETQIILLNEKGETVYEGIEPKLSYWGI